jgi:hypothetical protein
MVCTPHHSSAARSPPKMPTVCPHAHGILMNLAAVAMIPSQMHLLLSIFATFTHVVSISYNMKKRYTKGNGRESDVDGGKGSHCQ